jgi:DMSO reductase anchor subunit
MRWGLLWLAATPKSSGCCHLALALFCRCFLIWLAPLSAPLLGIALVSHIAGVFVERWLFFAEAKHVVSLYYGEVH